MEGTHDIFGLRFRQGAPAFGRLPVAADFNSMGADLDLMVTSRRSKNTNRSQQKEVQREESRVGENEVTKRRSLRQTASSSLAVSVAQPVLVSKTTGPVLKIRLIFKRKDGRLNAPADLEVTSGSEASGASEAEPTSVPRIASTSGATALVPIAAGTIATSETKLAVDNRAISEKKASAYTTSAPQTKVTSQAALIPKTTAPPEKGSSPETRAASEATALEGTDGPEDERISQTNHQGEHRGWTPTNRDEQERVLRRSSRIFPRTADSSEIRDAPEITNALQNTAVPAATSEPGTSSISQHSEPKLRVDLKRKNAQYLSSNSEDEDQPPKKLQKRWPHGINKHSEPLDDGSVFATKDSDESMFTIDRIDKRDGKSYPWKYRPRQNFSFGNPKDRHNLNSARYRIYKTFEEIDNGNAAEKKKRSGYNGYVVPEIEHLAQILWAIAAKKANTRPSWIQVMKDHNAHFEGVIIKEGTPFAQLDDRDRTTEGDIKDVEPNLVPKDYVFEPRSRHALRVTCAGMRFAPLRLPMLKIRENQKRSSGVEASTELENGDGFSLNGETSTLLENENIIAPNAVVSTEPETEYVISPEEDAIPEPMNEDVVKDSEIDVD